eukprot:NODE_218_length_14160_cov_0.274874.p2 type:complete len:658 gc:universal NODE_218_length_14160_cov_0.274874:8294-10267(+)
MRVYSVLSMPITAHVDFISETQRLYPNDEYSWTRQSQIKTAPSLRRIVKYKRAGNARFYPPYFYDINRNSMTPIKDVGFKFTLKPYKEYILVPVSAKLIQAACKRANGITDRVMRLSWKQTEIKRRLIIFQHRQTQKIIQLRAEIDHKQILATMRRQSYLWRRAEQSAMRVEKAITICNLRRLQKAQAEERLSSKNMVKKMNENAEILLQLTNSEKPRAKPSLDSKHLLPPISRYSLRELDITEIYSNMQLRHDLVFDVDMTFRPNTDGDKGTIKAMKAAMYWNAIQQEILSTTNKSGDFVRMPVLINEIKEIMFEMFQDSEEVTETLKKWDVEHIINMLRLDMDNGIPYIKSISKIMHVYCAPCRDELIDDMVALYQARFHVDALNKCLCILEHMRLDFANHNLRKLRPLLVAKSTSYEYDFFRQGLKRGGGITFTKNWIKNSLIEFKPLNRCNSDFYSFAVMKIITNSYMSETGKSIPETFKFDVNRINTFHNDWQDISIMNTLLVLFKQFAGPSCNSSHLQAIKKILWVLLNDPHTTMENVTTQIVNDVAKISKPLNPTSKSLLIQLVDSTLSIDSNVYSVIQRKCADNILYFLYNNELNEESLKSTLLSELKQELTELCHKIKKLVVYNQTTYQELYSEIARQVEKESGTSKH